jgi:hypothetical protein
MLMLQCVVSGQYLSLLQAIDAKGHLMNSVSVASTATMQDDQELEVKIRHRPDPGCMAHLKRMLSRINNKTTALLGGDDCSATPKDLLVSIGEPSHGGSHPSLVAFFAVVHCPFI